MQGIEKNYAMTPQEYEEAFAFVEKNIPGGVIVQIRHERLKA